MGGRPPHHTQLGSLRRPRISIQNETGRLKDFTKCASMAYFVCNLSLYSGVARLNFGGVQSRSGSQLMSSIALGNPNGTDQRKWNARLQENPGGDLEAH